MSVVVWDGKTMAADKRACVGELAVQVAKAWRVRDGVVLAVTGDAGPGQMLVDWWVSGADPAKWPAVQATDNWTRLIVWEPGQRPYSYEQHPAKLHFEHPFMAWGSGRDYALGALAMGATARQAVEIASRFNIYCGNGVDEFYEVSL